MKKFDYCPRCRRVTEQIKEIDEKLCKRCGKVTKRIDAMSLLCGHHDKGESRRHERHETPIHEIMEHLRGGK